MDYSFGSDKNGKAAVVSAAAQGVQWKGSTNVCHQWDAPTSKCMGTVFNSSPLNHCRTIPNWLSFEQASKFWVISLNTCEMMECWPRLLATCRKKRDGCEGQASFSLQLHTAHSDYVAKSTAASSTSILPHVA
jgi:hypothetical protein